MNKFQYVKNVLPGDNGADVYWRVLWRLQDDSLATMVHERVLTGVANQMREVLTTDENVVGQYGVYPTNIRRIARQVLRIAPLGWTGDEFKAHVAELIVHAIFPEGWDEKDDE